MAKYCGKCGSKLDAQTGLCPRCGTNEKGSKPKRKKIKKKWLVFLPILSKLLCRYIIVIRITDRTVRSDHERCICLINRLIPQLCRQKGAASCKDYKCQHTKEKFLERLEILRQKGDQIYFLWFRCGIGFIRFSVHALLLPLIVLPCYRRRIRNRNHSCLRSARRIPDKHCRTHSR